MTTAERRAEILAQLGDTPVAARTLATRYGVSRQVIVQDIAVIRAAYPSVISTSRGYVRQKTEPSCTREFKVRHGDDRSTQEMNLIVDCGGWIKTTSISHRVYGRVTVELDIHSRQDVLEFDAVHRDRRLPLSPDRGRHQRTSGSDRTRAEGAGFSGAAAALGKIRRTT